MSDICLKVKSASVIRNNVKTNLINKNDNNIITNKNQKSNEPIIIIHQTPKASMLKINSFVPNLKLQRLRKNSTNNFSLLESSTYIKRFHSSTRKAGNDNTTNKYFYRNTGSTGFGICTNRNFEKTGRSIYECAGYHKSLSSTAKTKSSSTKIEKRLNFNSNSIINSSNVKRTINLPLEYSLITNFGGVCKILRTQKEKEKLPDRINCDKRGLTSIPLFLNERNIRLLSLQHNLINVFHVPSEENCKSIQNNTEFPTNNENKSDINIIDLPIVSKVSKKNIYFDEFDLKIDATTNNGLFKKKSNTIIINGDCEKGFIENSTSTIDCLATTNVSTLVFKNTRKQHLKNSSINEGNYNINSKTICSNAVRNTLVKSTKIKNLILTNQTKQMKTFKGTIKYNKNSAEKNNIKSFGEIANTCTTQQNINGNFKEDDSICNPNIEHLFVDKVLLNTSYAEIYRNLIFLDLYNNQIEKILNLDGFKSLTVLLLGKNRITDISGIATLKKTLRVLDLHGNRITNISNKISDLHELKSLNLAGNLIEQICQNDFVGLINLKELNLKRNKIKQVHGFDHLPSLERLWLCHNDLQKIDDMLTIGKATNLQEITVENNPVSMAGDCVSFLVSYLPNLKILSQMPVTDQVRKAAMIWRKNKEISERNNSTHLPTNFFINIRREEVISNARTNWELLRSQRTSDFNQKPKTGIKKCGMNATIEDYIESGMKQFHTLNSSYYDCKVKTPIISSQTRNLTNTNNFQSICLMEFGDSPELQLPLISSSTFSRKIDGEIKPEITKSSSNSSLSPNLHSSSSGLGSDSEENCKIIVPQTNDQDILRSESVSSSSASSLGLISHKMSTKTTSDFTVLEKSKKKTNNQAEYLCDMDLSYTKTNILTEMVFQNNTENYSNNRFDTEIQTPKSESTVTSKMVNCSTKDDCSSSANSIMAVNYISKNVVVTNSNELEKQETKRYSNTTLLNTLKKCNKSSHSKCQTNRFSKNCNLINSFGTNNLLSEQNSNLEKSTNSNNNTTNINKPITEREREQGGDYLIEICGKYLNIYGIGALRFIEKQWNQTKACDVNTLNFSYINFNNIAYLLNRIKQRFPNAVKYIFRETNLQYLGQLNALADLQGIQSIVIDSEGNPITHNSLWKNYAIYRLNHWGLKTINNIDIDQSDIDIAHKEFIILSDIVIWVVPETVLHPIIHRLNFHEKYSMSSYPKEWLLKTDKSIKDIIGKEALQCKKYNLQIIQSEERCFREKAKIHFGIMIDNLCNAAEKLQIFDIIWPKMLLDIITNTLLDYSQMEIYLKKF